MRNIRLKETSYLKRTLDIIETNNTLAAKKKINGCVNGINNVKSNKTADVDIVLFLKYDIPA